ncbi:MAG TPA: hypothetical protein VJ549_09950 [Geothrix sp.]|nr:hypothetical protein [Geothrix sp.]
MISPFLTAALIGFQSDLPQLTWFGQSDPRLMRIFEWTLAHSASLRRVVARLPVAEPKARFRLLPGREAPLGELLLVRTEETYDLTLLVPVNGWEKYGDALEPWVASTFFLALDCAERGEVNPTGRPRSFTVTSEVYSRLSTFQYEVRAELAREDPERLDIMPVGGRAYIDDMVRGRLRRRSPSKRIPFPDGLADSLFH